MNIFITGATGYIGNKLALNLADKGHVIHALCRDIKQANKLLAHPNIKIFEGCITNINAIESAMKECTEVYHLAAYARVWAKNPAVFQYYNVDATENVLKIALKRRVEKVVFTSTAGVMGPSNGRPLREEDKRIMPPFNDYEISKISAECICNRYVERFGMHIVIANPSRVYGTGIETDSNAVTRLIKLYVQRKWKVLPGDGSRTGSYVHVDDVVNGIISAMQNGRSGERYLLSGVNASYNEFFKTLDKITNTNTSLYGIPVWAMLLAGHAMQLNTFITGKPPLLTPAWIRKYYYDWSLDCAKAQRELGYTFTPLEEGLRRTIEELYKTSNAELCTR